jgi:superfamily I DNA/RNA helicase
VAALAAKTPLSRIIAVTFTDKAAGEMKLRLRTSIEEARLDDTATAEVRALLDKTLEELEAARIGTIHSLAADLLRERPVEARVDPLFEVVAEESSATLFNEAFEQWFQRTLADPPEGVRRVLRRRARGCNERGFKAELRDAAWVLADHCDFFMFWARRLFLCEARLDEEIARLRELGKLASEVFKPEDYLARCLGEVRRFVDDLDRRERVTKQRDYDKLETQLRRLLKARHWK